MLVVQGYILTSEIDGTIQMKSYLTGNPEIRVALNEDLGIGRDGRSIYGTALLCRNSFGMFFSHLVMILNWKALHLGSFCFELKNLVARPVPNFSPVEIDSVQSTVLHVTLDGLQRRFFLKIRKNIGQKLLFPLLICHCSNRQRRL